MRPSSVSKSRCVVALAAAKDLKVTESAIAVAAGVARVKEVSSDPLKKVASAIRATGCCGFSRERRKDDDQLHLRKIVGPGQASGLSLNTRVAMEAACSRVESPRPGHHKSRSLRMQYRTVHTLTMATF